MGKDTGGRDNSIYSSTSSTIHERKEGQHRRAKRRRNTDGFGPRNCAHRTTAVLPKWEEASNIGREVTLTRSRPDLLEEKHVDLVGGSHGQH